MKKRKQLGTKKKHKKKNNTKMVSGPSGLPYYAVPRVVWVDWLRALFTLTVWTCAAITCFTTGLTIHWDVSSRTAFFAFRLSHFVLIETSWKWKIFSLRFECLDGSLFRKTPAHFTLWGESGWRTWALFLWKCVSWISIAHNLASAISLPSLSKPIPNYFHVAVSLSPDIINMDRIATARDNSTSPAA